MKGFIFKNRFVFPLVFVVLPAFVVYFFTLSTSVAIQGDSGELVTAAAVLGIAHPPGYPLYILLGHLFTLLPFGTVAWRVNLFAAVCQSLTLMFIYLTLERVTKSRLAAVGGSLILAFSYTFWLYGLVAEVFSLNDLLLGPVVYVCVRLGELKGKKAALGFGFLAFFFALGLSHHQTIVLLIIPLVYYLYPQVRSFFRTKSKFSLFRWLIFFGILGTMGFLPYLYVFIRAKTAVVSLAWSYPQNFWDLFRLFARSDYGSFSAFAGSDPALVTLPQKWSQVQNYLRFTWDDFTYLGVSVAMVGMLSFWKGNFRFVIFVLLGFFSSLFFLTYANFPLSEFSGATLAIVERFYLMPNIFVALAIGLGLAFLGRLLSGRPVLRLLPAVLGSYLVLSLFIKNGPLVDQAGNFLGIDFARNVLKTLPSHALLLPQGDVPTLLTFYARYVEKYRPDVELVTPNMPSPANAYQYLRKARSDLDFSLPRTASMAGLVEANAGKVRIFTVGPPNFSVPGFVASQSGLLFELKRKDQVESFENWKEQIRQDLEAYSLPDKNEVALFLDGTLSNRVILGLYSTMFLSLGDYCSFNKDWQCAASYYNRALGFDSLLLTFLKLGRAYEKLGECDAAQRAYQSVLKLNPDVSYVYADLADLAAECYKNEKLAASYRVLEQKILDEESGSLKDL